MTDAEKLALVKTLSEDYWAYFVDENDGRTAQVFLACIGTVLDFGGENNAAD